jgi:hypothetical protein
MVFSSQIREIFIRKPKQWGLRGDQYLWDDLDQHFTTYSLLLDEAAFLNEMKRYLDHLAETNPRDQDTVYISQYDHGGMSSGCISLSFWENIATPLLIKRLSRILRKGDGSKCDV